jgi:effector-binding domain-containing protein
MIVSVSQSPVDESIQRWAYPKKQRYLEVRSNANSGEAFVVYGILFFETETLYVLNITGRTRITPLVRLYSVDFFDVRDRRASTYWRVYFDVGHPNLAYDDMSFSRFNYIGVERLITDGYFYEKYLNGENEEEVFMRRVKVELEREAAYLQDGSGAIDS